MILYRVSRFLLIPLFRIIFRLEVKGSDNFPRAGGFILASNHVSYLDPIVLGVACPRQLNFMARHDLFTIPIFGAFIRSVGAFPLRRNSADIVSIKEALRRLRRAGGLVLFPEGRRSPKEVSQDAQPGIGFIAVKSQVPVVPAFIDGTQRALGRNARFIRPTRVRVYFGRPIYPVRPVRPVRDLISNGVRSMERIKEKSKGVYSDNKSLRSNYEDFANGIMKEIDRLSQEPVSFK